MSLSDTEGQDTARLSSGPIVINLSSGSVQVAGKDIDFPKKELDLLVFFLKNPVTLHTRDTILAQVWGPEVFVGSRTIDVHIRKIRAKLGEYASLIETIKGVGYRFRVTE
ncbi:MAG: winged helix-turn-helix domain-containing protein [Ignavibacteria bacterium]|nr:winged helix-turn-helix domain-containing protein [Ignavibacteria bacterium]